jgi:autotransporter-associated beta strand protein
MLEKTIRRGVPMAALLSLLLTAAVASAQSDPDGYNAMLAAWALPSPPGTGVVVEQNEAPLNSGSPWQLAPNASASYLNHGITITYENTGGTSESGHADSVAQVFYGNKATGIPSAYGVTTVDLFNADIWAETGSIASNTLNVWTNALPSAPPANDPVVANFSWVGSGSDQGYQSPNLDNDALRRFDWYIDQYNLVGVVGVSGNAGASQVAALMACGYNSIAVGLGPGSGGLSAAGPVPSTYGVDGAGRSKPDVVAWDPFENGEVSFSIPVVSAEAATLEQVARYYSFSAGTNAAVIKAVIMASANKNPLPNWGHTPTVPLDPQWGTGQINFNWAYQVMTAGPQTASTTSLASSTGWAYSSLNPSNSAGNTQTYFFQVPSGQPYDLSALVTWERMITVGTSSSPYTFTPSLATIDLSLYQANGSFTLGSLLQSSSSSIDNVQYVFDRGLPAGEYALQVTRVDSLSGGSLGYFALAWQTQGVPLWAGTGNGSWNSASNWSTGFVPNGLTYEAALIAPTLTGVTVTLDAPQTLGQLTLGNSANATFGYTISAGSAGTLTFSNSGSNSLLTVISGSQTISAPVILVGGLSMTASQGATLNISGLVTESGSSESLTLGGAGAVNLSGSVVLSSGLTLTPSQGSTLNISGVVSQSSGSQPLTLNGQGAVILSGSNTFSGGTTIDSGTLQIGAGGAAGAPGAGPITNYSILAVSRSDVYTLPVSVGGSGQLVQLGPGALILPPFVEGYSGQTVIDGGALRITSGVPNNLIVLNGGVLESNSGSASFIRPIGSASGDVEWASGGGGFSANGGLMSVNIGGQGTPQTLSWGNSPTQLQGPLIFGSLTANNETDFLNPINLNGSNGTVQVNVGQGGDFAKLLGAVSNSTGTGGLVKTGNGLLVLAATNTYNGPTTIDAGTLQISSTANLGSGGLVFDASGAGVLDITGSLPFTSAMPVNLNENGTIRQDDSARVTLSGAVNGPGMLIKSDSGVLVLSGTNNYAGGTSVTGGELQVLGAAAIAGGNLSVGNDLAAFGSIAPTDASLGGSADSGSSLTSFAPAVGNSPASSSTASPAGVSGVPEPGSLVLLVALGACGIVPIARRSARRRTCFHSA